MATLQSSARVEEEPGRRNPVAPFFFGLFVALCVCVCERERGERKRERDEKERERVWTDPTVKWLLQSFSQ